MNRPDTAPDHVTPYDRLALTDLEAEALLAGGGMRRELTAYFGEQEYAELARLAREAHATPLPRDAQRVLIVPGIMGSQLGLRRSAPLPHDVVWLDPVDIESGRLTALRVPDSAGIVSLSAVLYSYLRLKLHLRVAGFDPQLHHYDWRLGVDQLGRTLAQRLRESADTNLMLIGHSMGGLVSRVALTHPGTGHIGRLILLGTPNFGSFAPVQALRGTYAVVRKVARLDGRHTAETLAERIFTTFPSLYHMLPAAGHDGAGDLFDPAQWPQSGPRPHAPLLTQGRQIEQLLAPADARFAVVVGVDQETVTAVQLEHDDFVYTITRRGDGTVPSARAELPGAATWYTATAHSELTRDREVVAAIIDLLHTGATSRLATQWAGTGAEQARISDRELRLTHNGKVDWAALTPDERRLYLQNLNEPPLLQLRVPAA